MYSKVSLRVTQSLGFGNTRVVSRPSIIVKEMHSAIAADLARQQYLATDEFKKLGAQARLDCVGVEGCPRDEWPVEVVEPVIKGVVAKAEGGVVVTPKAEVSFTPAPAPAKKAG